MIRTTIGALSEARSDAGHDGPIKLRLPPGAFAALVAELGVEVPAELQRGARRTVRLGSVEVVE
ncbi:MAG: hypothetical protein IPK60_21115 [Sandaracinaceae bacterium]|nr:hypothetical protein [Sandaracinaceae bacterium]